MKRVYITDPVEARKQRERERRREIARQVTEIEQAKNRARRERGDVPGLIRKGDES